MTLRLFVLAGLLYLAGNTPLLALAPHEVAVLVNTNRFDSLSVANHFVERRGIPHRNIIPLGLPERINEPGAYLTVQEFNEWIYKPAEKILTARGVNGHILAWVYSTGFPVLIKDEINLSLHGSTFTRGKPPPPQETRGGQYLNRLYQGPNTENGPTLPGFTLDRQRVELKSGMPLPAMSLGMHNARGNSLEEIRACIDRGVASDYTRPDGTVVFALSEPDVRTKCRAWEFDAVVDELESLGIEAHVRTKWPGSSTRILGLQAGLPYTANTLFPKARPGAMAEHLTSHAANFHHYFNQTKLSEWIRGGMTASAGTVTEPYAIWTKFPHARFYAHYGRGCTMLESFAQSVRCPLQLLLVGEPLARPFAPRISAELTREDLGEAERFTLVAEGVPEDLKVYHQFLVDGRPISGYTKDPSITLKKALIPPGTHALRGIVYTSGNLAHHAFAEIPLTGNRPDTLSLRTNVPRVRHPGVVYMEYAVQSDKNIERTELYHGSRLLGSIRRGDGRFAVGTALVGLGRIEFIARTVFEGGAVTRSATLPIQIVEDNEPPEFGKIATEKVEDQVVFTVSGKDPENDVLRLQAYRYLQRQLPERTEAGVKVKSGRKGVSFMDRAHREDMLLFDELDCADIGAITARISWETRKPNPRGHLSGLVFNLRDAKNYDFFGLHGESSAWVFATVREGRFKPVRRVGKPIRLDQEYLLTVHRTGSLSGKDPGLAGRVNGELLLGWTEGTMDAGRAGLYRVANDPTWFDSVGVLPLRGLQAKGMAVQVDDRRTGPWLLRLSDGRDRVDRIVKP